MAVEILRRGSQGKAVERWQNFLVGQGLLRTSVEGDFGPKTEAASKAFQRSKGLTADGIVGPKTIGKALESGFDIGFRDRQHEEGEELLAGTSSLKPTTLATRKRLFGEFEFKPKPTASNPEGIEILGEWEQENIQTVRIPQLKGIPVFGTPSSGRMRFHGKAVDQLKAMWQAWDEAGLLDRILTYEGSFNARFIRGSRTVLSNHAFGSAFDINQKFNRLGTLPSLAGSEGSVRELVPIANEHGFVWGGHFKNRPDGMHFEVAKLL